MPKSVTIEQIESLVVDEQYYVFPGTTMTTCLLTLENGYHTLGQSACADPANFDAEVGRSLARRHAIGQVWALEGYLLRQKMHEAERAVSG